MRRLTPQPQSFRFRHYMRGNYAAFRSLHRVVSIGHVAGYIADAQLRKWGKHNATIADSSIESETIPSDRETDSPTTMLRQVDAMYMLQTADIAADPEKIYQYTYNNKKGNTLIKYCPSIFYNKYDRKNIFYCLYYADIQPSTSANYGYYTRV